MHSSFGEGGAAGTCQGNPAAAGQACSGAAGWAAAHSRRRPHCLHPTASITPVEDRVQVLSLTSPPAFSLLCLTQLCLPQSMSPIEQVLASPRLKFAAAIH